jgi:preprotein translocase subunit SecD
MNKIELNFEWDETGSELSKQITGVLVNGNQPLGIFTAEGRLLSAPSVKAQISDSGRITNMTQEEAQKLSNLLNAGRLEVPLTPGTETTVGTALGEEFVNKTFLAAIISLGLVMVFMIIYYRLPGVLASLALLFYRPD